MALTYIFILILLFVLIRSVIDLSKLIIYGTVPQKQTLKKAFERLEGKKTSVYSTSSKQGRSLNKMIMDYLQTFAICSGLFLLGLFFFRSIFFAILVAALGLFYPKIKAKKDEQKVKDKMLLQFREAILSLASSLKAGSSLQTALQRCERDLTRELQFQKDKPMLEALEKMNGDIYLGTPVEKVLLDFKDEHDIEDIQQFVDAIIMTRSKGGNLADVIYNTSESISDKIMIQQEIKLATTQKKMEAGILTFMPVGLVSVLMVLNPGYMEPMYDTAFGMILLFMAVLMLVANYFIGRKVTNINI